MSPLRLLAPLPLLVTVAAAGQDMDPSMHAMPGMRMPMPNMRPTQAKRSSDKPRSRKRGAAVTRHHGLDVPAHRQPIRAPAMPPMEKMHAMPGMQGMDGMPGMAMPGDSTEATTTQPAMTGVAMSDTPAPPGTSGMTMAMPASAASGTDLLPGAAPAPLLRPDHLADRIYGAAVMATARRDALMREHGGGTFGQVLVNILEYQAQGGRDGYRWDGDGWIGGDVERVWLRTEGEGRFGGGIDTADVQALYSRAIGPYYDVQAGVRQAFGRGPSRTAFALGIQGLAPYGFETEARLFLTTKGDLLGRVEAWYDERITQVIVVQPRLEANVAAQDVRENGIGAGLQDLELGLRLRYECRRDLAPYVGVTWQRDFAATRRFEGYSGDRSGGFAFVLGVRTWF